MVEKMSKEEAGTRAFDALERHPGGLNRKMWLHHAGLTEGQLRKGLDWLNDLFEHETFEPYLRVWRGQWTYAPPILEVDVREHMERQLRTQITRTRREHNFFHKIALKFPTEENEYQEELSRRRLQDLRYAHGRISRADSEQLSA